MVFTWFLSHVDKNQIDDTVTLGTDMLSLPIALVFSLGSVKMCVRGGALVFSYC